MHNMVSNCPTCGKPLKAELRHLRLGLDEAPALVVCRCDDVKDSDIISSAYRSSQHLVGKRPLVTPRSPCDVVTGYLPGRETYRSMEYEVRLNSSVSERIYKSLKIRPVSRHERGRPISVFVGKEQLGARLRVRSSESPTVKVTLSRTRICPGMTLCSSLEVTLEDGDYPTDSELFKRAFVPSTTQEYNIVVHSKVVPHVNWILRCDYHSIDGQYAAELEFTGDGEEPGFPTVASALVWLHSNFGHEMYMSSYLPPRLVSLCTISAASVLDVLYPLEDACVYRAKADGETMWVIEAGYMWYVCRPNDKLEVVSWILRGTSICFGPLVSILRVEQLMNGSLVYIDLLAVNSMPLPPRRKYIPPDLELLSIRSPPRMIVRLDFDTIRGAQDSMVTSSIPTDGIIAIERDTLLSYRIKAPTVDLKCTGKHLISGGDIKTRLVMPSISGMRSKVVYECTLSGTIANPIVVGYFPRVDKRKPNSGHVTRDVLSRLENTGNDGKVISRQIQSYSFAVREYTYNVADNLVTSGRAIIDVGAGRLQSRSFYQSSINSFLLCDPHLDTLTLPRGFGTVDATDMDSESILRAIKGLNKGRLKYLLYRRTAEELMDLQGVFAYVKEYKIPMVYSFSVSRVHGLFDIFSQRGVPQVGSLYLYDDADADGYILNDSGVYMRVLDTPGNVAVVRFPPDHEYEEPAVDSSWFHSEVALVQATQCVEFGQEVSGRLLSALKGLYVVQSRAI